MPHALERTSNYGEDTRSVKKNTRIRTKSTQRKVSLPCLRRCCSIECKIGITGAKSTSNTVIEHLLVRNHTTMLDTIAQVSIIVNIAQVFCISSNVFRPLLGLSGRGEGLET